MIFRSTTFFENNDQMGIPHEIMVQLQPEGIQSVADLAAFDKDSLQQLGDNLRKPAGRIADLNPNAAAGATIPTSAFTYGAKSQKRLSVACNLIRYFQTVGRDLIAATIQWNQVMSVENSNTRLLLISCSQGILSSSSFSCYLLLRLLVYMYLSQLMRTFTNYLKCSLISS